MVDRTSAQHPPTPEQQAAIDLFTTIQPLVVKAGAGTGKTTTLAMMARTSPRPGAYVAFNRAIALDAEQAMPNTVQCRTMHSLAMAAIRSMPTGPKLLARLQAPRMAPYAMAKILHLGPLVVDVPQASGNRKSKVLQPGWQASHVLRAVRVFCQSADIRPGPEHFPYVDGIDPPGPNGTRTYINNDQVAKELAPALDQAWADLTKPDGQLRFSHDIYLKMWQLAGGRIPADFIFFDEAQDANGVMVAALLAQDAQLVWVGDDQQQIYEWRGAINAMDLVPDHVPRTPLTQSWRFGPNIAGIANLVLDQLHADLRLTGTERINSQVAVGGGAGPMAAVLCRSNAAAVQVVLNYQAAGQTPHLVGGSDDIVAFARAADQLQTEGRTGHPELCCFDSWREVQDYVDQDPHGADLKMLVTLIDKYGPDIIIQALDGLSSERDADVIVSTAHKAKGREWPTVRVAADFEAPEFGPMPDPEWRLLYVAATRASSLLDISTCFPLRDLVTGRAVARLPAGQ